MSTSLDSSSFQEDRNYLFFLVWFHILTMKCFIPHIASKYVYYLKETRWTHVSLLHNYDHHERFLNVRCLLMGRKEFLEFSCTMGRKKRRTLVPLCLYTGCVFIHTYYTADPVNAQNLWALRSSVEIDQHQGRTCHRVNENEMNKIQAAFLSLCIPSSLGRWYYYVSLYPLWLYSRLQQVILYLSILRMCHRQAVAFETMQMPKWSARTKLSIIPSE